MPHERTITWIGDDGIARRGVVVLTDDHRAFMKPHTAARRRIGALHRKLTPEQQAQVADRRRSKATLYATAEASLWSDGPVSDDVFDARVGPKGCGSCSFRRPSPRDPLGYCGACGCGAALRAMLTVKGRMPKAACPLDPPRWHDAPGQGADALQRIRQAAGVAAHLFDTLSGRKSRREKGRDHSHGQ